LKQWQHGLLKIKRTDLPNNILYVIFFRAILPIIWAVVFIKSGLSNWQTSYYFYVKYIQMKNISIPQAGLILRIILGITMLSAVADRFGLWGAPGDPGVAWGNWENFIAYTQTLNPFVSKSIAGILGILATSFEIVFGIFLIIGFKTRIIALGTSALMLLFALSMAISISIKAPFDYSVLTSSAAALLLAAIGKTSFSADNK
jgi:uncharacterized membrane protein YphA (DoxX/SURF4 family)